MQVIFMRELVGDPFYAVLREYDRCVIDYCLLSDEMSYRGLLSHERAILYAMLKVIERYLDEMYESEVRFGRPLRCGLFPWSLDMAKAKAEQIDAEAFLHVPAILRTDRNGNRRYDCGWPDVDAGEYIPYWYAFWETPHTTLYGPEEFRRVNAALFPKGTERLAVCQWSTDWSNHFDDGHEWWGAACWSVYDPAMERYAVLFASATD